MILNISIGLIVLISIAVFLTVILLLVSVLLYARKKLMPSGEITLTINEDKEYIVNPGASVLSTLANQKIFLPSACGGGGTCAMCKCQVFEGGGSILPTEVGYFTRKEQQNNWRLGCQVKVKENMKIGIPKEIFGIKKWECEVISNRNVATFIKEFVVKLPEGESLDFESGGYIQIDVPKCEVDFKEMIIEDTGLTEQSILRAEKLLEKLGFTVEGEISEGMRREHFAYDKRPIAMASISKDAFLKIYSKEKNPVKW